MKKEIVVGQTEYRQTLTTDACLILQVYVCDLGNCSNVEEITPPSITAPQKIVADSYNG